MVTLTGEVWRIDVSCPPHRIDTFDHDSGAAPSADGGTGADAWRDTVAAQQQVRNLDSNTAAFAVNGWLYSLTEAWAWDKPEEQLVRRERCPWDDDTRRPSHADKRKALQRQVLHGEISQALAGRPSKREIRQLIERLLDLAA